MRLAQKIMTGMLGGGNLRYQPNENLPTDLISWWTMTELSGGTAQVNRLDSTNENKLTDINTVSSRAGVIGNGADFVAANSESLRASDSASLSMGDIDFAVIAWVQFDIAPANNQGRGVIGKWNTAANREYIILWERNDGASLNHLEFLVSSNGTTWTVVKATSLGTPQINTPYFVVAWHDSTENTINIQVNNGTVDSTAHTTGIFNGNSNLCIGSLDTVAGYYLDGMVDEAAIWKRKLTEDERTWLYNDGAGRTYSEIFTSVDFADLPGVLRQNAASALTTPTYDTSGQATHPSVIDFRSGNTWNGYRYWMAMTPYPSANDDFENPSILTSADGATWDVPTGGTNPIIPAPVAPAFNSDPEIFMTADGLTMWMLYRWQSGTIGSPTCKIYAVSTTDGITWSAPVEVLDFADAGTVSPAVALVDGVYKMWYVDDLPSPYTLVYRSSASPASGYSAPTTCTINNMPAEKDLWHISVRYDTATSMYHMFANMCDANTYGVNGVIYFAYGSDGLTWTCSTVPLLSGVSGAAWDNRLYRASGVKVGDTYDLYYGGISAANAWRIGRTTIEFTVVGAGKA